MNLEWDKSVDAAYIVLLPQEQRVEGVAACTVTLDELEQAAVLDALHSLNLDFDREGRLIGIEVLRASRVLPIALLESAQVIG